MDEGRDPDLRKLTYLGGRLPELSDSSDDGPDYKCQLEGPLAEEEVVGLDRLGMNDKIINDREYTGAIGDHEPMIPRNQSVFVRRSELKAEDLEKIKVSLGLATSRQSQPQTMVAPSRRTRQDRSSMMDTSTDRSESVAVDSQDDLGNKIYDMEARLKQLEKMPVDKHAEFAEERLQIKAALFDTQQVALV